MSECIYARGTTDCEKGTDGGKRAAVNAHDYSQPPSAMLVLAVRANGAERASHDSGGKVGCR